jgi:hypothetical protein
MGHPSKAKPLPLQMVDPSKAKPLPLQDSTERRSPMNSTRMTC